ncbi:hypothetical protein [Glaciibacter superstes]|uniref:hypothetical protein n=1 Tax=Glaciibacter superstes TaxID=501023 RepID=UPI00041D895C
MVGNDWIEHRRGDGELVGWMIPRGEDFVVVDLLGRERSNAVDWLTAEETLEDLGIGYLADLYMLALEDGRDLRVRIAEVSPDIIRVKKDDFGAVAYRSCTTRSASQPRRRCARSAQGRVQKSRRISEAESAAPTWVTPRAEYIAVAQLQADAFVTGEVDLAHAVNGMVTLAPFEALAQPNWSQHQKPVRTGGR